MNRWGNDMGEFDEMREEENEELLENELEIPDVDWAEDIAQIKDPELREKEIIAAENLLNAEEHLNKLYATGKMDQITFENKYHSEIRPRKKKATTRCGLETVGITFDDLGDLVEDYEALETRDLKIIDQRERLKEAIKRLGPEAAQELADRMYGEKRLDREAYEKISGQVRRSKGRAK